MEPISAGQCPATTILTLIGCEKSEVPGCIQAANRNQVASVYSCLLMRDFGEVAASWQTKYALIRIVRILRVCKIWAKLSHFGTQFQVKRRSQSAEKS